MMGEVFVGKERSALWVALQRLSQGAGIQRVDLVAELNPETGELGELQKYWNLDLSKGLKVVRYGVWSALEEYVTYLEPRKARQRLSVEDRKEQYLHAVRVSFNMSTHRELDGSDLSARRNWLAKHDRGTLKIAVSVSQDDLNQAIDQIEMKIRDECSESARPEQDVQLSPIMNNGELAGTAADFTLDTGNQEDPANLIGQSSVGNSVTDFLVAERAPKPKRRVSLSRRKRRVLVVSVVVVVVAGAFFGIKAFTADGASGSPNAAVTQPLVIESITSVDPEDGPFNYVFPQKVSLSRGQLTTLDSLFGHSVPFGAWVTSRGAVKEQAASLQVVLRGNTDQPAIINDIQIVATCSTPLTGTLLDTAGQADNPTPTIGFNLDDPFPIAQNYSDNTLSGSFFAGHTISLAHGEVQTIELDTLVTRKYCQYYFIVQIDTSDKGQVSETIDDHGKQFQLTSDANYAAYQAIYSADTAAAFYTFVPENPATYQGGG